MLLATDLAVLDHSDGTVLLIANAVNHNDLASGVDEAYADAVARLDAMEAELLKPVDPGLATFTPTAAEAVSPFGGAPYRAAVEEIKERIRATRPSRWCPPSASRRPARPPPWTSTGCCGPPTPARTCTCSGSPARTAAPRAASTWSAPARRRW